MKNSKNDRKNSEISPWTVFSRQIWFKNNNLLSGNYPEFPPGWKKLSLLSSEASNSQSGDSETLPDIPTPKVELSESEKTVRLAELKELREVLMKSCFITTQEAKFKMKFAKSVLENFSGDPQSEEGKRLVQEFEEARVNCQENKKVFKSLVKRDRELCDLLGMDKKECKMLLKKENNCYKKQCKKKFKHHQ